MTDLPKGTLSEEKKLSDTTATTDPIIKVVAPAPTPLDKGTEPDPTITKEPIETDAPPSKEKPNKKEACTFCKAKSIANVAFSFSLVLLVLAFSFSLVKTKQ
jgi:hypothetical protein